MRSEFRFPRSAVVLMVVIFLGIVLSLETSHAIQLRHGVGLSLISVYSSFWKSLAIGFGLASAAAVAGWAVLFALGRSGLHRLAHLQTWPEQK